MDIIFLIIVAVLMIAWILGRLMGIPSLWNKIIGDSNIRYKLKKSIPMKRPRKAY